MPLPAIDHTICGSRRAFLDLGANDGQSLARFHSDWQPRAATPYTHVVAFEMNSAFRDVLLEALRPLQGTLEMAAVWISDGTMIANMQTPGSRTATKHGILYNMTSSALQVGGVALNKYARSQRQQPATERAVLVRTVDFSSWLSRHFCHADDVAVKMDIEGAEFEVLEHLLRDGSAALVDTLAIEWHTSKRGQGGAKTALIRRQANIVSGFTRAGCKVVDWKL
jgi:FkbM family methyltransferase